MNQQQLTKSRNRLLLCKADRADKKYLELLGSLTEIPINSKEYADTLNLMKKCSAVIIKLPPAEKSWLSF